ncbi:MAG: transcription termination factor Rho [Gemmataceae bacterium]
MGRGTESSSTTGVAEGILEPLPRGGGFLRSPEHNLTRRPGDAFVPEALIRQHSLRPGLHIAGPIGPGTGPAPRLLAVEKIEGMPVDELERRDFDLLTPVDPREWLRLETGPQPLTTRVMDLLTPLGRGQRALIVAPPRSGKTILLQDIAAAVEKNYPQTLLIALLIDERPEEVTEFRRRLKGWVVASSSDRQATDHTRLAELTVERSKRLVEQGRHVFLLLDSLTRLARAYNKVVGTSGRTMTGGIDVNALEKPKRLFGTARAFEEGGSLTIVGTILVETGSRMDDIIFQEFKGTGNMELVLDRRLADRRIFPAVDLFQSGTRKEELLHPPWVHERVTLLRRGLSKLSPTAAMENLVSVLARYPSNEQFLEHIGEFLR